MFVSKNIEHKETIQTEFYEILSKYIYKYINHILKMEYDLHKASKTIGFLYQNFQKRLLKISKWSDYHIDKEYGKFLKWVQRKYNYSESDLQKLLDDIIILTIQVMIHKPSLYVEQLIKESHFSIRDFYYKCLKKLARIFYEAPKSSKSITLSQLKAQIDTTIHIILPTKKINTVLELEKEPQQEEPLVQNITYDFNKIELSSDKSSNTSKTKVSRKSDSSMSKEHILYYISSDKDTSTDDNKRSKNQYEYDYIYQSNSSDENQDNLIKEIYIPKKQKYYYNKSKIDEINEYYFNE